MTVPTRNEIHSFLRSSVQTLPTGRQADWWLHLNITESGSVPERSNGEDCKSFASASVVRIHSGPPENIKSLLAIVEIFYYLFEKYFLGLLL